MELEKIAKHLGVLGNPSRLAVFRLLVRSGEQGATVGEVQDKLKIPGSTLTHHLQKLMGAGLVIQERQGARLVCHADFDALLNTLHFFLSECCADDPECCAKFPVNQIFQCEKDKK